MMRKRITALVTALAAAVTMLAACGGKTNADGDKLQVYASFYAMYDFARLAAGTRADVHNLCPAGTEPHDFELTARDMAELSEADVLVYNGLGMESWVGGVLDTVDTDKVKVVEASKNVSTMTENLDPHVWLNPQNALEEIRAVTDALIEVDPEGGDYYESQYDICVGKINGLTDKYNSAKSEFKSVNIVTEHDAYASLSKMLGLTSMSINGFDAASEPSPAQVAQIEEFIKTNGVKYIFTEPLVSDDTAASIAEDTGCGLLTLDPFEGSTEEKDYFTVMEENLEALKTALS